MYIIKLVACSSFANTNHFKRGRVRKNVVGIKEKWHFQPSGKEHTSTGS